MFKATARTRFPHTFDEAFRTPSWFDPVEGPFRRQRAPARTSHWWVLALVMVLLALVLATGAGT